MTTIEPLAPGKVIGPYCATLIETALALGITEQALAEAVGWPATRLTRLPAQVDVDDYLALMEAGARAHSCFGLQVGAGVRPRTYPILAYTIMSCATAGEVIDQVIRYESLNHDLGRSRLEKDARHARFLWTPNRRFIPEVNTGLYRHLVDSVLAGLATFSPWLTGERVPLRRVAMAYPQPEDAGAYQAFFGCPVIFGQPANLLEVDAALLDLPIRSADPVVGRTLQEHAEKLLQIQAESSERDTLSRLRRCLVEQLPEHGGAIEAVALSLHLTVRTLQRRLSREGTSYQRELDDTRHALAGRYLRHSRLSIGEVAERLGYKEQSSFSHAFKAWTGLTPVQYRSSQLPPKPSGHQVDLTGPGP